MSSPLTPLLHLPTLQPEPDATPDVIELGHCLNRLSRRTRQVFLLSRLDQWSYTQIAEFLELGIDQVEHAMVRVLRQAHQHAPTAAETVQEQANRWYVHLQSPAATASQRIEFRHWLDSDQSCLSAFEVSERLWRQLRGPAILLGASGWHRRKRRAALPWCLLAAFVCGLMVTAEAISQVL